MALQTNAVSLGVLGLFVAGCDSPQEAGPAADMPRVGVEADVPDSNSARSLRDADPQATPPTVAESGTVTTPGVDTQTPRVDTPDVDARQRTDTTQPDPSVQLPAGGAAAQADSTSSSDANAEIMLLADDTSLGTVDFRSQAEKHGLEITAHLSGLQPGEHGIHIHENGDCSGESAAAAGDHFTPDDDPHGGPTDTADSRHAGDLGNLQVQSSGAADLQMVDEELALTGEFGVIGRAVVIHAGRDDLTSQPSGDSGDPIACGIIARTS